ncbi:13555_t:CDS:1, partial [Acaulospora morrowiae]
ALDRGWKSEQILPKLSNGSLFHGFFDQMGHSRKKLRTNITV